MPSYTKRVLSIPKPQAEDLVRILNNLTPSRVGNNDDYYTIAQFVEWAQKELAPERPRSVRSRYE